ncbi:MAG TPA: ABC transporter ATP-binding protein [Clostridiaceae bacterium]
MNVIEVTQLTKIYGKINAVDQISFNVKKGEIFGMLGPNGAGKTTTIECIIGLKKYEQGIVNVVGLNPLKDRNALYGKIGVQLQETSFQDKIKVKEICSLFESFYKNPYPYEKLIDKFGLKEKLNSYVDNLSGGQKQKLSIILALIPNPEIVFLDELTTGLDPQARQDMWKYVKELKEEGRTVFMTTHYMEEAEYLCDRICIIKKGKIIALDTVENIIISSGLETEIIFEAEQDITNLLSNELEHVSKFTRDDHKYIVYSQNDGVLGKLVYMLETKKISYKNLNIKRPTLDDTFLKLIDEKVEEA